MESHGVELIGAFFLPNLCAGQLQSLISSMSISIPEEIPVSRYTVTLPFVVH